jgi:N-glycosylase/DNA lyase
MRDERVAEGANRNSSRPGFPHKRGFLCPRSKCLFQMPRLTLHPDQQFSLEATLGCGQVFRWETEGDWWHGIVGSERIRVRQRSQLLHFSGCSEQTLTDYFQLDLDLETVLSSFRKDPFVEESISLCKGLRIIRQPAWECLASYICATYANIPGIKRKISLLAKIYGQPFVSGTEIHYSFPSADALAVSGLGSNSYSCSLGYRSPYLHETARQIAADRGWDDRIRNLPFGDARQALLRLKGVGPKVADCVLLFAFGRYEAFPVDVWITRIMQRCYGRLDLTSYEKIARAGREYFGPYAGYAQEYLFCNREAIAGGSRNRRVRE